MIEYPKIQSIYKRDEKTHKFTGVFSLPEFAYLQLNHWTFTEKIDGTNVRVMWDGQDVKFGGRTNNAQMPIFLYDKLRELFPVDKFAALYPDQPMTLYGEGYGAKIQKGGGNYIKDGVSFILFDVLVDSWWLRRPDVENVASALSIDVVPIVGVDTLFRACEIVRQGFKSTFGDFIAEGLVLKPTVELFNRMGQRIVTKVKHTDF